MKQIILVFSFVLAASAASAGSVLPIGNYRPRLDPVPQTSGSHAVAFQGDDVVAFRSSGRRIRGDARFAVMARDGRTYLFVSEEHRLAFLDNQDRFVTTTAMLR